MQLGKMQIATKSRSITEKFSKELTKEILTTIPQINAEQELMHL